MGMQYIECCAICGDPFDPKIRATLPNNDKPPVIRRTILGWQRHVHAVAKSRGWYLDEPDEFKLIGSLMAETAELWQEACKPDFDPKRTYYGEDGKPEGLLAELSDVVMRAMSLASVFDLDLEAGMAEKSSFNERREYRHGGKRA